MVCGLILIIFYGADGEMDPTLFHSSSNFPFISMLYKSIMLVNLTTLNRPQLSPQKCFWCDGLPSAVWLHHCSTSRKLVKNLCRTSRSNLVLEGIFEHVKMPNNFFSINPSSYILLPSYPKTGSTKGLVRTTEHGDNSLALTTHHLELWQGRIHRLQVFVLAPVTEVPAKGLLTKTTAGKQTLTTAYFSLRQLRWLFFF